MRGEVFVGEVVKPGFLDNDGICARNGVTGGFEAVFAEFFDDFALGDEELAGFEVGASAGGIFPGFLGETGEGVIDPEMFRGFWKCGGAGLLGGLGVFCGVGVRVFHKVFHRSGCGVGDGFLKEFAEENGGVATVAAEFDEVAFGFSGEGLLGEAEDFRGFVRGDLVVDGGFSRFGVWLGFHFDYG